MSKPVDFSDPKKAINRRLLDAIVGEKLIGNTLRGLFAEAMIAEILNDEWDWVAGDWSSWDFEHRQSQYALEIKQSAARQPWSDQYDHKPNPRFDIAPRTGYWVDEDGNGEITWVEKKGRAADAYIFCWHDIEDDSADHRDTSQWKFFVCDEKKLPKQKTIGLSKVKEVGTSHDVKTLTDAMNKLSSR